MYLTNNDKIRLKKLKNDITITKNDIELHDHGTLDTVFYVPKIDQYFCYNYAMFEQDMTDPDSVSMDYDDFISWCKNDILDIYWQFI